MPQFSLRWANRSNSTQDWQISNGDGFTLAPNYVRNVDVDIHNTYTYQIAVSTNGGFAACQLTWAMGTGQWAMHSLTPGEWQLAQGNGIVTLRCLLANVHRLDLQATGYVASSPAPGDDT